MSAKNLNKQIVDILEEMKALEIINLDVRGLTDITDNMIICSGTSNRHTQAIADKIITQLKTKGIKPLGVEGMDLGEWILVDFDEAIIHIMLPNTRKFYSLEKLWSKTETLRNSHAG